MFKNRWKTINQKNIMSDVKKLKMINNRTDVKNFILIILFAIIFSFVIQDGIRLVIQKFLEIPNDYMGLAQWGDTFFLRIFASLIGTAAGTFVIGTFLKNKAIWAAIIATLPTVIFWIAVLIFGITIIVNQEYSFETVRVMLLLPSILAILSPAVGYLSARWGQEHFNEFQRPKSILNVKWYHWLWIFPFYLNKVVAIPLFTLILLWKIDLLYDTGGSYLWIFDFISNWSYYLVRIAILFVLGGLIASISHVYSLLSEEKTIAKINWKNGLIIFGHVLLFLIFYILLFGEYL